jgi:tetratricopeptide (TPR) repeat protein
MALMALAACGRDEAQREAMAAAEIADHGGPLEEQIAHYDRAIELAPERSSYWESRAGLRMSQCDNVRALADVDRAVELADRPYLRFRRGLIL